MHSFNAANSTEVDLSGDVVTCNVEFPNVYLNCLGDLACDRRNKKHLEVLNFICYISCHLDRVLRSDCL